MGFLLDYFLVKCSDFLETLLISSKSLFSPYQKSHAKLN